MPTDSILLDSSVVVRHFRNATEFTSKLEGFNQLFLPAPSLAELYYGAFKSNATDKNIKQIERFLAAVIVLHIDEVTCKYYGTIAAKLAVKGKTIPQNDIWIASLSRQFGLSLATLDEHFKFVEDLNVQFW